MRSDQRNASSSMQVSVLEVSRMMLLLTIALRFVVTEKSTLLVTTANPNGTRSCGRHIHDDPDDIVLLPIVFAVRELIDLLVKQLQLKVCELVLLQ